MLHARAFLIMSSVLCLTACGPNGGFTALAPLGVTTKSNLDNASDAATTPTPANSPSFKICSSLNFPAALTWPSTLKTAGEREALKLALNISGSFEGRTGWANLTNDFDGQGLSMGLLNQTLGTGSLEPLFIEMRDRSLTTVKASLASAHVASWLAMLSAWEGSGASSKLLAASALAGDDAVAEGPLSPLDVDVRSTWQKAAVKSRHEVASDWARANLYDAAGKFLPAWSKELTALATSPQYISLQVGAAARLHAKAVAYQKLLGTPSLRAYLFFFDISVQNGALYDDDLQDFNAWIQTSAASPSEEERLIEILGLRLRHVKPEYESDVRDRKMALIKGAGLVHGSNRKLEKEYCYSGAARP